ncbi:UNVERIFIED_CONTAM: hypothetical protein Scaly_0514400 [Sesamum calycinum]|uniref:BP28 C-terminal domain-containing protein n=1 Tax=Sesamum calycinum TaxID=2727403 RepID=A0AAW2RSB1_9LAMI
MAGTSISSQLKAIKDVLNVSADPEPGRRRPLTRPSVLFDAKAAADIDLDTILNIALSGLEVLISMEERFRNYKNDLFSYQSKELDRELVGQEENNRINASISSYLRLLSGYLELHSSLKTLEYLIRRYKVHVYSAEDLILCALPYHDTHVFVQIVQLINTGNNRWKFLDGVKTSGARPPREVIVQQCIRDLGVLEAICNYATPVKKIQPSKHVIGFCTAVIFEVLGLVTIDNNIVKRILPYVNSGLQPGARGLNQKAGALMIVSLLAQKAALGSNVVKSLLHSVADIARVEAKERASICGNNPKKTMDVLSDIRDISGILSGLTKDFNIDKFLAVFLDSLLEYSASDDLCHQTLLSIIETVPVKVYVDRIVSRLLSMSMKISQGKVNSVSSESGNHGKQILVSICDKYPNESRGAFYNFLKDAKLQSKKVSSGYDFLCKILDEHLDSSQEISNPKVLFALEHSEAEIRRSAVLGLDVVNILREKANASKKFGAIQDALFRRLYDDDLNVVLAVLELKNLSEILSSAHLIEAVKYVLQRCIETLLSGSLTNTSPMGIAALSCLQQVIKNFKDQEQYVMMLATTIFPLLLIRPKTQRLNLKALELAKELKWPLYESLVLLPESEKKLDLGRISSINVENISKLAEIFSLSPVEYMAWLVKCCDSHELSRTLFFLVLLQSLKVLKMGVGQFCAFLDSCLPILKNEWEMLESVGISAEQSKKRIMDSDCRGFLDDLGINVKDLNAEILACLFLRLSEAFIAAASEDVSLDMKGVWECKLQELFLFFACHSKDAFRKHLEYLFMKCKSSLARIMLKLFTEEGLAILPSSLVICFAIFVPLFCMRVSCPAFPLLLKFESLQSFSHICSQLDESSAGQFLAEFPSVLIPLSSDNQNVRAAAMSCIEELFALWSRICRNGNNRTWLHFLGELLCLIIQQKKILLSDRDILASFFSSLLGSSSDSLLVQDAIGKRFDASTKDDILVFMVAHALGLSSHAKLKILSLIKGVGNKLMSISGVRSLLNDLLEIRRQYYLADGKLCHRLSQNEVNILCLLLESCTRPASSHEVHDCGEFILKALQVNGAEGSAIVEPCMTVLRNLSSSLYGDMKTETQERLFRNLLVLFRSANGDIQNSTRDALLRINLDCSIVGRVLDSILDQKIYSVGSSHRKKQKKSVKLNDPDQSNDATPNRESTLSMLTAFLDVLLMKKNIDNRTSLVGPLFKLLHLIFTNNEWMLKAADQDKVSIVSSGTPHTVPDAAAYVQQSLLLTLEDISASIGNDIPHKDIVHNFDLQLLVSCARTSGNAVTRNHVFSLITTLVKIIPDKVLDQILDILCAIGESTVTQYSTTIGESIGIAIHSVCLKALYQQLYHAGYQGPRIQINYYRTLGEAESLGSLLFLLFHSLISRKSLRSLLVSEQSLDNLALVISKQWEYEFALQLCEQYSCTIWLPSLILALQKIGSNGLSEDTFMQMLVAMQFVANKLRDPEISYKLETDEDLSKEYIFMSVDVLTPTRIELCRVWLVNLWSKLYIMRLIDLKKKHTGVPAVVKSELKEYIRDVLKTLTRDLLPSTYFTVMVKLIRNVDKNVRKKALGLLCETVKDLGTNAKLVKKGSISSFRSLWLNLKETSLESFDNLCLEILTLLDASDDDSSTSLNLAAISALEVLANRFPSHDRVFTVCLGSVCKRICSDNSSLSSHCLRATGALVNALGPRALPELPNVMECVLRRSRDVSSVAVETKRTVNRATGSSNSVESLFMSILLTLEAVVNKLAGFLNPYLADILRLIVLHPLSFSPLELNLKLKADIVRKLITEKIPVRLLLPPVLSMYSDAIKSGESSLSIVFEMLGNLNPDSVQNIDVVEQNVINAVVTLTMKLTETMFRPLFIKTIEWSGLNVEGDENTPVKANSRAMSFYSLVNKLAESHRSLFVPYFKYLLDGCVRGLVGAEDTKPGLTQKKKKAKLSYNAKDRDDALSLQAWHLRALILSSLHKCFLYDTGSAKFLDSSNFQARAIFCFLKRYTLSSCLIYVEIQTTSHVLACTLDCIQNQVLLKPLVSQLVMDPPVSIENHPNVPSVKEVDELLVACVGQMAVTAGSDLLWKPLNHEVLMHTRSEKVRARILGLRIVKSLLENLKEEYLVLLPETIPFLGELLEDAELSVKSLAQEILKEMETMSGESLRQYL